MFDLFSYFPCFELFGSQSVLQLNQLVMQLVHFLSLAFDFSLQCHNFHFIEDFLSLDSFQQGLGSRLSVMLEGLLFRCLVFLEDLFIEYSFYIFFEGLKKYISRLFHCKLSIMSHSMFEGHESRFQAIIFLLKLFNSALVLFVDLVVDFSLETLEGVEQRLVSFFFCVHGNQVRIKLIVKQRLEFFTSLVSTQTHYLLQMLILDLRFTVLLLELFVALYKGTETVIELFFCKGYYPFAKYLYTLIQFCNFEKKTKTAFCQLNHNSSIFESIEERINVTEFERGCKEVVVQDKRGLQKRVYNDFRNEDFVNCIFDDLILPHQFFLIKILMKYSSQTDLLIQGLSGKFKKTIKDQTFVESTLIDVLEDFVLDAKKFGFIFDHFLYEFAYVFLQLSQFVVAKQQIFLKLFHKNSILIFILRGPDNTEMSQQLLDSLSVI